MLNFCIRREVAHVVDDTATKRVSIVAHHLVQEAAQIISLRVPVAVLKIDKNQLSGVVQGAKNIVFLAVVVREHDFFSWYELP